MIFCRGETFRKEFSNIGEARSLLPPGVCMMALTATATKSTRQHVCQLLGMVHPFVVSVSPNRKNIKYILKIGTEIEEIFEPLVDQLRRYRVGMGKVIIFCRGYRFKIY